MRLLTIPALLAALAFSPLAYAQAETAAATPATAPASPPPVYIVNNALVTFPNSTTTLELGKDVAVLTAVPKDAVLTMQLSSMTPKSGFVIKGLPASQFNVTFTPKGEARAQDIAPSAAAEHAFTYLPLPLAANGGVFTITLPTQGDVQPKKKAFLN